MKILALSGSLRTFSINTALLKAAAALVPEQVKLIIYDGLGGLPPFNPDQDTEIPHVAVARFRCQLRESSGVIISTPEYAHGLPGVLKNALDWLVASGELYDKPVALFNTSPRATHAQASLIETLTVMTARIVSEACVTIPLIGKSLDDSGTIAYPEISNALQSALASLQRAITFNPG